MVTAQYTCPFCTAMLEVDEPAPSADYIKCPRCGTTFPSTIRDAGDPRAWPETVSLRLDSAAHAASAHVARLSQSGAATAVREAPRPRPLPEVETPRRSLPAIALVLGAICVLLTFIVGGGYYAWKHLVPHNSEPDVVPPSKPIVSSPFNPADEQRPPADGVRPPPDEGEKADEKEDKRLPQFADGTPWVGLAKGNLALEIDGDDLDGKPFRLSEFRGKVVVLDFWADWCVYCRRMYPFERDFTKKMEGRPFVLVGVNCDQSKSAAKQAVQRENMSWRSWWDGRPTGSPITRQWHVNGFPRIFIIDHKGLIREEHEGMPEDEQGLANRIQKLVEAAEKDSTTHGIVDPPARKTKDVTDPASPPPSKDGKPGS